MPFDRLRALTKVGSLCRPRARSRGGRSDRHARAASSVLHVRGFLVSSFFLFFVTVIPSSLAGTRYAGEFLSLGAGARGMAMGGAQTAASEDVTAAYWNSAALTQMDGIEVASLHRSEDRLGLGGDGYDWIALGGKVGPKVAWAVSYLSHSISGVPLTRETGNSSQPFEIISTSQSRDSAVFLSGALDLGSKFSTGLSLKILESRTVEARAKGVGLDLGLLFRANNNVFMGLVLEDATGGTPFKWSGTPTNPIDIIPINLKAGFSVAKRKKGYRLVLSMDLESQNGASIRYGAELLLKSGFSARLGLVDWNPSFSLDDKSPSMGFGLAILLFELDYGLMVSEAGLFHHVSLLARFKTSKRL